MSTFYHNKFSGHLKHQNITDGFLKKIQSQILVTWVHMLNSLTIFNSTFTSGLHAYIYLLALIAAETFNFENEREWPFHQKLLTLFYGSKLHLPLNLISLDFVTVWLLKSILLFRENPWYANVLFFLFRKLWYANCCLSSQRPFVSHGPHVLNKQMQTMWYVLMMLRVVSSVKELGECW